MRAAEKGRSSPPVESTGPRRIELSDDAFLTKAQTDTDFRQALVLDPDAVFAAFRISERAQQRLRAILKLLDLLLAGLVNGRAQDATLRQILADPASRQILLFAPREAGPIFEIQAAAQGELDQLAATAGALFEALLGGARPEPEQLTATPG